MSTTQELDIPEVERIDFPIAPPEEASNLDWWLAATEIVLELVSRNREAFEDLRLSRPSVYTWTREISFSTYSLRELKTVMAMLPQPGEWRKDSDGQPKLHATVNGWDFELRRNDLTCELVETGEVEEYEDEEVVEPAKTKTVTRTRPVTVRECPSIMSE